MDSPINAQFLVRENHRLRTSQGCRRMPRLGVVSAVHADTGHCFSGRDLARKFRPYRRVVDAVAGHFDGRYFQRAGIDSQMRLAPLPPVLGRVLLAFSPAFSPELDPDAVHQQTQRRGAAAVRQLHPQQLAWRAFVVCDDPEYGRSRRFGPVREPGVRAPRCLPPTGSAAGRAAGSCAPARTPSGRL